MLMRNKRTVEKLRRGDLEGVRQDSYRIRRSFKFMDEGTLRRSKGFAKDCTTVWQKFVVFDIISGAGIFDILWGFYHRPSGIGG